MNKINWTVRLKNKYFWLGIIPAVLMLIQVVANTFGLEFETLDLNENLTNIVNSVFVVLAIVGIVTDPTTKGFGDSQRAMTYEEPKGDD